VLSEGERDALTHLTQFLQAGTHYYPPCISSPPLPPSLRLIRAPQALSPLVVCVFILYSGPVGGLGVWWGVVVS
jgi:hypothetical protein